MNEQKNWSVLAKKGLDLFCSLETSKEMEELRGKFEDIKRSGDEGFYEFVALYKDRTSRSMNRFDELEHTIMLLVVRLKTKGFFNKEDVDDVLRLINREEDEN